MAIYTYFALGERTGLIKIGKSNFPWRRVAELRNSTAQSVRLLATIRGDLESAYHHEFASHRAHGEWFHPAQALIEEILAIVADDPQCAISNPRRPSC